MCRRDRRRYSCEPSVKTAVGTGVHMVLTGKPATNHIVVRSNSMHRPRPTNSRRHADATVAIPDGPDPDPCPDRRGRRRCVHSDRERIADRERHCRPRCRGRAGLPIRRRRWGWRGPVGRGRVRREHRIPASAWPAFAACLRAHGANVADPVLDKNGDPQWAGEIKQFMTESVRAACQPIIAALEGQKGGRNRPTFTLESELAFAGVHPGARVPDLARPDLDDRRRQDAGGLRQAGSGGLGGARGVQLGVDRNDGFAVAGAVMRRRRLAAGLVGVVTVGAVVAAGVVMSPRLGSPSATEGTGNGAASATGTGTRGPRRGWSRSPGRPSSQASRCRAR